MDGHSVIVITSQSLKNQLNYLKTEEPEVYRLLLENIDGIYIDEINKTWWNYPNDDIDGLYIDEAHHQTNKTLSLLYLLHEESGAFLYGTTTTSFHHEINFRDYFKTEVLFEKRNNLYGELHDVFTTNQDVMEQPSMDLGSPKGTFTPEANTFTTEVGMKQPSIDLGGGEIIPFDDLIMEGSSTFKVSNTVEGNEERSWLSYDDAKVMVQNLGVKTIQQYLVARKIFLGANEQLPPQPAITYRGKGWFSRQEFLGTK